jgi:mycothiol synthase
VENQVSIQIRNYREQDLPLIVVLLNAAEAVDRTEEGTSIEEQSEFLARPELRPQENVLVAEDEDGRVVAFAGLMLKHEAVQSGFRTWFNVHPMFRGRGLEDRLLARLEERARERLDEARAESVYLASDGHTVYEERLRAMKRAGMSEVRRFWVMLRPNLEKLPAASFAPELIVRNYRLGEDDAEALDARDDSFSEHFAHSPNTMEWWQYFVNSKSFRPDLSVLAIDPRSLQIAGFCHIVVNQGECQRLGRQRGWVEILGVRKPYRHHGLGTALILQGMRNLREAGFREVALGCDSENTTGATRLYFRVGFQVHTTFIAYAKYLRGHSAAIESERILAFPGS